MIVKYIFKLTKLLKARMSKAGGEDEKLFASPKKTSHTYNRALVELKSYCRFLMSDSNINTGRELHDIRRAVDDYLNP